MALHELTDQAISILHEVEVALGFVDPNVGPQLVADLLKARQIFCLGAGRSGILLRAFCMRLNHLGSSAYMVGGLPCPPAGVGDLIVAASGSGTTVSVVSILKRGRAAGARVILFTASEASAEELNADVVIRISAPSKLVNGDNQRTRQPMRSLFEQTVFILCEALVCQLRDHLGLAEAALADRHANLE